MGRGLFISRAEAVRTTVGNALDRYQGEVVARKHTKGYDAILPLVGGPALGPPTNGKHPSERHRAGRQSQGS